MTANPLPWLVFFFCILCTIQLYQASPEERSGIWMSLGAGLSTTLGALLVIVVKNPGPPHVVFTSSMAAAVMLIVSVFELLIPSVHSVGVLPTALCFSLGWILSRLGSHINFARWIPLSSNKLTRLGVLTAFSLTAHNLPEGMAVILSSIKSSKNGAIIAVAIALHNIPEGLAIAAPLFAGTQNAYLAFLWTFCSGLSEPLGALIALFFLKGISLTQLNWLLSAVAGVMCAVSLLELLPASVQYVEQKKFLYLGAAVGTSIVLLEMILMS